MSGIVSSRGVKATAKYFIVFFVPILVAMIFYARHPASAMTAQKLWTEFESRCGDPLTTSTAPNVDGLRNFVSPLDAQMKRKRDRFVDVDTGINLTIDEIDDQIRCSVYFDDDGGGIDHIRLKNIMSDQMMERGFSGVEACDLGDIKRLGVYDSPSRNSRGKLIRIVGHAIIISVENPRLSFAAAEMDEPDPRERIC